MDDYVIVCAKFDFVSSTEQELSFRKGDKFILIDGRKDWWLVQTFDTEDFGYVPCNFMKAEKRNILSRIMPRRYHRKPFIANLTADVDTPADMVWKVKHSYEHKNVDELSLRKGAIVYIIERKNDGWWFVESGNRKGWFPSNYLNLAPINDSQGECVAETAGKKSSGLCGIDVQFTCLSDNSLQMANRGQLQEHSGAGLQNKRRSSFRLDANSRSVDRDFGYSLRRFRPKGEGDGMKRCNSAVQLLPDTSRWDPYKSEAAGADFACNSPKEESRYALCLCSFNSTGSSELNVASGEVLRIIRETSPDTATAFDQMKGSIRCSLNKRRCSRKVKVENSYGQTGYVPLDVLALNDLYPSWNRSRIARPPESSNKCSAAIDGHRMVDVPFEDSAISQSLLAKAKRRMDLFEGNQAFVANGRGQFAGSPECFQAMHSDVPNRTWYFGCLSRDEADELLNTFGERGDFLLRDSYFSNGNPAYCVSVRSTHRNRHFRVYPVGSGEERRYLIGRRRFRSLDQLVEFYSSHAIFKEPLTNERALNTDVHRELRDTFTHKEELFLSKALIANPCLASSQMIANFEL